MSSMKKEKKIQTSCYPHNLHKIKRFLQACPIHCKCFNFLKKNSFIWKTSFFASFGMKKASLTVEAALAVPLFLFAILNLYSIMEIYETQMCMQAALHQTAKELAVEGYAYSYTAETQLSQSLPVQVAFSESYVRGRVNQIVSKGKLDHSIIKNGSKGISYSFSKIMEKDCIELVAIYGISPRFTMVPFADVYTFTQAKVRAFTGYDPSVEGEGSKEEEVYVYVTNTGTAYHVDRGCTYLKLSIKLVSKTDLAGARNENGGRYKACRYCKSGKSERTLFLVTNQGDKYHTSVSCTGLKRTIKTIPLSKAGGYHPCSRCGN